VYRKDFEIPATVMSESIQIDLGVVRELAEVKVNGKSCGNRLDASISSGYQRTP